jgi:hypothetical protein
MDCIDMAKSTERISVTGTGTNGSSNHGEELSDYMNDMESTDQLQLSSHQEELSSMHQVSTTVAGFCDK